MLSCKEVSCLASKGLDSRLSWRERFGLWMHLMMCRLCRRYVRDQRFMRKAFKQARRDGMPPSSSVTLPKASRERIRQVLSNE
ncbi:MAG: hypothetical protein ACOYMG_02920 [Candidatus Methylumidiphilus sp.]